MLEERAKAQNFDILGLRGRVYRALHFDVSLGLRGKQLDGVILELGKDRIRKVLLLALHVHEALPDAGDLSLRLMHQLHDVVEATNLNLISLKCRKKQVAHHADVFDFERDLEHVLAGEFLNIRCIEQLGWPYKDAFTYFEAPNADG